MDQLLPERGPAECVRGVRRGSGRDRRPAARVRRERFRQPPGRLLRDDAGAHPQAGGDGGGRHAAPAAAPGRRRAGHRVQRPGAAHPAPRQQLPDDRRADQRHRIAPLRASHQGHGLRRGVRGGARSGAGRRQHHRRQHGRGHARFRSVHEPFPPPDRDRARNRAGPDHGRQLEVVGPRGGAEVRAGQGHRQLDQPEGGRTAVPRSGAPHPALRRGDGRDGVRRDRPGRHGGAEGGDLLPGLPAADRRGGRRARGHHLRPERARGRHRSGRARRLRRQLHRGDAADQAALPRREGQRRHLEPLVLLPGERHGPRGDARRVPLPRGPRRPRHGDRQRGPARRLRGDPGGPAGACRGRHLQPARRRHRAARPLRRRGEGERARAAGRPLVARDNSRRASRACAGAGHRRLHRSRCRGSPAGEGPSPRRDRRPVDERHEGGGRSLRRGQDVPAAGREERARHEEGGGVPAAVHGGGAECGLVAGDPRAGDGQGGRPRHRQEHRRGRASLQQLQRGGPRRDGAVRRHPAQRVGGAGRPDRVKRIDHAVARRDGVRGRRDGAADAADAAAHRRRDDVAAAHRGEDRAGIRRQHGARRRRLTRGRRRFRPAQSGPPPGIRRRQPRRSGPAAGPARGAGGTDARAVRGGVRQSVPDRLGSGGPARPGVHGPAARGGGPGRADAVHRLDVLFRGVGTEGTFPGHPRPPGTGRGGARAV